MTIELLIYLLASWSSIFCVITMIVNGVTGHTANKYESDKYAAPLKKEVETYAAEVIGYRNKISGLEKTLADREAEIAVLKEWHENHRFGGRK